jgi:HEAT repeat protein
LPLPEAIDDLPRAIADEAVLAERLGHLQARGRSAAAPMIRLDTWDKLSAGVIAMRTLVLACAAVLFTGCGAKEPLHKGKAESYWREAVHDKDKKNQREAITALGALKDKDAIPTLIEALKNNDAETRAKAAEALWSIGPEARSAVPALVPLLKDKQTAVRLNAAGALGQIGAEAKTVIPALRGLLKDGDVYVRVQAATSLGKFGAESVAAVPPLTDALRDRDKVVRTAAAYALAEIGPPAKAAIPALKQAAKEKDGDVRTAASIALKAVQG